MKSNIQRVDKVNLNSKMSGMWIKCHDKNLILIRIILLGFRKPDYQCRVPFSNSSLRKNRFSSRGKQKWAPKN